MNWSVAEPAIGILVSSMPAIRAIRYIWRKPGDDSYGSGTGENRSTFHERDQICLSKFRPRWDEESAKMGSSEEGLVIDTPSQGQISKTTKFEVTYSKA